MSPLSVREALATARASGVDGLDAQLLLASCLDRSRSWLIAHDDAVLTPLQAERYGAWLARRAAGEPLAYLFGEKEFHGLRLQVDPRVLVPRPDTETVVELALELVLSVGSQACLAVDRPDSRRPAKLSRGPKGFPCRPQKTFRQALKPTPRAS